MPPTTYPAPHPLGDLLRYWRAQRGKSQLDLSLDAGVSQRHLSFIESGRSTPSRDLLLALAQTLDIPLRERNALLLAAGYAPLFPETALDAPDMAIVARAIDRVLLQQEPWPALVLDRHWNVLKTNQAAPRFFGSFVDLASRPRPRNLLDLVFDPNGLRPFIENWELVASSLLERVHREAVGHVVDGKTLDLLTHLRQYPGVSALSTVAGKSHAPVIPITFRKDGHRSSFFSLITTVGTPQSITAQELRIECMFPADPDLP